MPKNTNDYSQDQSSLENYNVDDKYSVTGESEFSRDSTIPFDQDEVLSERHYNFGPLERDHGRQRVVKREPRSGMKRPDHRGKGPIGYRRSNESIKEDVSESLYRNTQVDASGITVSVSNGVVTLDGLVDSREQKKEAEQAVENLAGVEDVYNYLKIKQPYDENSPPPRRGLMNNITGLN